MNLVVITLDLLLVAWMGLYNMVLGKSVGSGMVPFM